MHVSLKEELGQNVCSRTNSTDWESGMPADTGEPGMDEATSAIIDQIIEPKVILEELLDKHFGCGAPPEDDDRGPDDPGPDFGLTQNDDVLKANRPTGRHGHSGDA